LNMRAMLVALRQREQEIPRFVERLDSRAVF
jgi:hypothetical protein